MSNTENNAKPTMEELLAQVAKLKAENDALKAQTTAKVHFKVSEKGALSLYGMGRFPVTLYKGQWETIQDIVTSGKLKTALAMPGLKNKEDETPEEAKARQARVAAYSAEAAKRQAETNATLAANAAKDAPVTAVPPTVRKAQ